MDNIMQHTDNFCLKILIGNKCDLEKLRKDAKAGEKIPYNLNFDFIIC